MKAYQIFVKLLNLVAIAGYILNIVGLLEGRTSPLQKINGIFHLFLVVFLLTLETQELAPQVEYLSLYKYWLGRGLFFIWISMISLDDSVVSIVGSSITGLMGIIFVSIGILQNCCCCRSRDKEDDYVQRDSPEDHQPSLPSYTKRDPREA